MKKLLLVGLILVTAAPMAWAGGVNLTWGEQCWSDLHVNLQTFACDSNSGTFTMCVSWAPYGTYDDFLAVDITLMSRTSQQTMPDWWMMDVGQCRPGPGFSADFTGVTASKCVDPWAGGGETGGGFGQYIDYLTPGSGLDGNTAWMKASWAHLNPAHIDAGVEYYGGKFILGAAKTVGSGACAGCLYPMSWAVLDIYVSTNTAVERLTDALPGGNGCLHWQDCSVNWVYDVGCSGSGCSAVPVRNSTWGQIKSFYR